MKYISRYGRLVMDTAHQRKLASIQKRHGLPKALCEQCVAYILTNLICYFSVFGFFNQRDNQGWGIQFYRVLVRPLEGFFSLLIFVGHKAYDIRRMNPSLLVRQAVIKVFTDREEKRLLISNISLVRDNEAYFLMERKQN